MAKIEVRAVDPANYTDVLLAAAIMAANAQHLDGPAKKVLTNIHVLLDMIWNLDVKVLLASVDDRPCCIAFGDSDTIDTACIPHFKDSGVRQFVRREMKRLVAVA